MKIIRNGYELALYLYKNNYEDELRELFEEYFEDIKGWDRNEIEGFFEENTAIEYFKKLYDEKRFERKELYFRGFKKYRSEKEYDEFIEFCLNYYDRFFEGDPDFLKNTEYDYIIEFIIYENINAVLIRGDFSDYEIDIIKKFVNFKRYLKLFERYEEYEDYKHIPLEKFESQFKYVIWYRGGMGYTYDVYGYIPSKIR
jgi:hypothetical protein